MVWSIKKCLGLKHLAVYRKRVLLILMLAGVGVVVFIRSDTNLPNITFDTPNSHVVGMPPSAPQLSLQSYSGKHPSALTRPEETFEFPIRLGQVGPKEPLFAGPLQYPFLCGARASGLGQPLVDNYQRWGVPVYKLNGNGQLSDEIIGYSKDCAVPTQARYYYKRVDSEEFFPLSEADGDIAKIELNGKTIDFIVRVEIGTINRFLYAIAVLKGEGESLAEPNGSRWNNKLIYQFRGGVGIGFTQGKVTPNVIFTRRAEQLAQGYAVVYSSGTQTSNHYNMWLAEDTALRVKRQFVGLYGEPSYTVGVGGSGGAIQQFLLAQNNPDIIDAAIAQYSYPDMVTQTTYAMDCELLEYYFDVTDRDNDRWQHWPNRQLVEGLNAVDNKTGFHRWLQRVSQVKVGQWPSWSGGESECVNGWRGLTPLVHNPRFSHKIPKYDVAVANKVKWSHWNDLKYLYGTDEKGYGLSTWDNVGVQYGLRALKNGDITTAEFLKLNASVGGWKPPEDMDQERFWFLNGDLFPVRLSVWSHSNMYTGSLDSPAKRTRGSVAAMQAAYRSGQVFLGHLNIPVIGLRHYLEPELDMHHLSASLSVRQRMLRAQGHTDNHLIWVTSKPHNGEVESFELLDKWLANIEKYPQRTLGDNRPADGVDKCFNKEGQIIAAGDSVWDGQWNQKAPGQCAQIYKPYTVSRYQAGADIAGDIFKCYLQPVEDAVANGVYGDIDMREHLSQLKSVFPDGVCDYRRGDSGRPTQLLAGSRLLPKSSETNGKLIGEDKKTIAADSKKAEPIKVSLYDDEKTLQDTDNAKSL